MHYPVLKSKLPEDPGASYEVGIPTYEPATEEVQVKSKKKKTEVKEEVEG